MNPKVILQEWDLSDYIPSYAGIYAAIIGPFYKGPSFKRVLMTSPTKAINKFGQPTHYSTTAYFSALAYLEKSNKLWMTRVHDGGTFASVMVRQMSDVDAENKQVRPSFAFQTNQLFAVIARDINQSNLYVAVKNIVNNDNDICFDLYVYENVLDLPLYKPVLREVFPRVSRKVSSSNYFVNYINRRSKYITVIDNKYEIITPAVPEDGITEVTKGYPDTILPKKMEVNSSQQEIAVRLYNGGEYNGRYYYHGAVFYISSAPTEKNKTYDRGTGVLYVDNSYKGYPNGLPSGSINLNKPLGTAIIPEEVWYTDFGEGKDLRPNPDCLFLVYASSEGEWGNDLSVRVDNVDLDEEIFDLIVYMNDKDIGTVEVERHTVSLTPKKNGYGRNMFIEERINNTSEYIRVKLDPSYDPSTHNMPYESMSTSGNYIYHKLTGGKDSADNSDAASIKTSKLLLGLDLYRDRENVPVTLFMDGGITDPAWKKALVTLCEDRTDCMAILTVPADIEECGPEEVVNWKQQELLIDSSYGALYTPHVYIQDAYNDSRIIAPIDGMVAGIYSRTAVDYEMWYAPAGWRRGVLNNILDMVQYYDEGYRDYLYDNQINCLRYHPSRGIAVWGQKTLQTRSSALDRVNVRLLLIYIESQGRDVLEDFEFEINDEFTRKQVELLFNRFMESIQARRGVYDFKVVCNESNNTPTIIDQNKMYVDLYVQPTKVAEFIYFRVIVTPTGVNFGDYELGV